MALSRTQSLFAATSIMALLSGCTDFSVLNREAGAAVDTGYFGNATMNNMQIHSGQKQYVANLAGRFNEEVTDTVTFAFNSAQLDSQARAVLAQQAGWIRQFPEVRFRVYGHTDLVGSTAYNKRLGLRRANAVISFFASQGISRSRLEAVASYGETRPVVNTQDRERRNRRTVTEVSGFVQDAPMVLNGKYAEVIWREYVESAAARPSSGGAATGLPAPAAGGGG